MIPVTGRGMAGKTSLMRALQSPENTTLGIDRNDRTLGIDLATWKPNTEGDFDSSKTPVEFTTYDFAGQDSYYSRYLWPLLIQTVFMQLFSTVFLIFFSHQLFLTPRAVYMIVWSVQNESSEAYVISWLMGTSPFDDNCFRQFLV